MKKRINNIRSVVTWSPVESKLVTINDVDILLEDYKIFKIVPKHFIVEGYNDIIDAKNTLVTPGFVDSHTHPIFVGNRSNEFKLRTEGKTYQEIAKLGGGIISSIKGVRENSEEVLYKHSIDHVKNFIKHGTTTIEAKSGYGLSKVDEINSLKVIKRINNEIMLDLIPTFMGAHAIPPEYKNNPSKYIDLICDDMIPTVAEQKLAEYCDVFCEKGYFSKEESKRILETAISYNINIRMHADEFIDSGGALLAGELNAVSADHLMEASDEGIQSMINSGVIATLLPGTTLFLGKKKYANARRMIDMGCSVALATDFNPGSCTIQSMPLVMSLACLYCGMTPEETFISATWNGARALNRQDRIGAIHEGYIADLIFWDIQSVDEIPYWIGSDHIQYIMKNGKIVE